MTFGFPSSRHGSEYANDPEETVDEQIVRYASGMERSSNAGKPRPDLLMPKGIPYADQYLTRCAMRMAEGAKDRGDRNWEKSCTVEELDRARESAFRHLVAWLADERDEDHAAAIAVNVMFAETIAHKIAHAPF